MGSSFIHLIRTDSNGMTQRNRVEREVGGGDRDGEYL